MRSQPNTCAPRKKLGLGVWKLWVSFFYRHSLPSYVFVHRRFFGTDVLLSSILIFAKLRFFPFFGPPLSSMLLFLEILCQSLVFDPTNSVFSCMGRTAGNTAFSQRVESKNGSDAGSAKMTEPSKVIHVRNVGHEISENDLLQLVQPFGVVTKLVMLRAKNQALLQMHDVASAINALQYYTNVQPSVRGRNVYIQFSSHQELTTMDQNPQGRKGDQFRLENCDCDAEPNRILLVTIHHLLYPITVEVLHQVFSPHGFVEKIVTFQKSAGQLLQDFKPSSSISRVKVQFKQETICRDFTNPSLPSEQKGRSSQPAYGDAGSLYALQGSRAVAFTQMGNAAAIAAAFGGGLPPGVTGTNDRCTILTSNLDPDKIDEDKLFNLFSLYGNIVRIKLLRNKPDHALIQMADGFQAELAVHFLKGAVLFGKRLEVNFSKHPNITSAPDTREYSGSSLNRFNRNAAKNYRYCCAPTKMIHLSTLPQDISEEDIVAQLEEHGTIVSTKLFEANGKKQALVLFENEEQATEALVCKHASSIDGSIIRISFSQLQSI
ncbi:hypothetical protein ACLOJK_032688 [Asimina triloba]